MKQVLIMLMGVLVVGYVVVWVQSIWRHCTSSGKPRCGWFPTLHLTAIGFVTNFFDTLGIGNFAPTTAWFRNARLVSDELIPGTMNVGHTLPVMLMAFIYIEIVRVEPITLLSMIASSVLGAWLGAGIVTRLRRKSIQIGMGVALIAAALLMTAFQFNLKPGGDEALGLDWLRLIPACLVIGVLGALMTIGVGLYAPCMILVSLLGMNPVAAFPIMMGACAFLMPFASTRFVRAHKYHLPAALGLTLGGLPAVLIAAFIVKTLPLYALKWLVIVIVLLTAIPMLREAFTLDRDDSNSGEKA